MKSVLNKYAWFALKIIVLGIAVFFITQKIEIEDFKTLKDVFNPFNKKGYIILCLVFVGSILNWYVEVIKWKTLAKTIYSISFAEAFKQTLIAFFVGIATPQRVGEFGIKPLFYKKKHLKKILFLQFVFSGSQMLITLIFGAFGLYKLWYLFEQFYINNYYFFGGIFVFILFTLFGFFLKKKKLSKYLKKVPFFSKTILLRVVMLSLIRYLIFGGLFLALLYYFNAIDSVIIALPYLFLMYLFNSILPMLSIVDIVIKSSVAVWVFSFLEINPHIILSIVLLLWIFNTLLPSAIGGFLFLRFKKTW